MDTVQNGRRKLDTEQYILWLLCGLDIAHAIQNWQLEKCQTALWGIEVEHGETVHTESPRVTTHHADYESKPIVHGMRHARISGLATRMPRTFAGLAQLVEQTPCKRQVKCPSHLSGLSRLAPYRKIGANHSWPGGGSD